MNNKLKVFCIISLFYFCIFISSFNINTKAQDEEFTVGFTEGTELIWEVTDLNLMKFKETFGFEPNFEQGDQNRMIIRDISSTAEAWIIEIEFWDYKADWGLSGETISLVMSKNAAEYDDYLFSLHPVDSYLDAAIAALPPEYYRDGLSLFKQGRSTTGLNYLWEKEYDTRGILIAETVYDDSDNIIVRLEGTFRIVPFGIYFIGFTALAVVAIIVVSIRRKRVKITISESNY
ncbi:MAG: hypothetical protein EAX91_05820 [Candidatus Lokiarchaeota archaeon]|nr:hypothetical protein [Candidatus Lokiarchaeota archaeon]